MMVHEPLRGEAAEDSATKPWLAFRENRQPVSSPVTSRFTEAEMTDFERVYRDWEKHVQSPASVRHGFGTDSGDIPEGSMRVAPNTDAVVWRICPDYKAEL